MLGSGDLDRQAKVDGPLERFLGLGGPTAAARDLGPEQPRPGSRRMLRDDRVQALLGLVEPPGGDGPFGE